MTSAVGALSLEVLHESGTVPKITDTVKTGGNTISTTVKPPKLTAAQTATERACIQKIIQKTFKTSGLGTTGGAGWLPGREGHRYGGHRCLGLQRLHRRLRIQPGHRGVHDPGADRPIEQKVVVPEQTITRVLNPPTTNTATSNYSVAGVDPSNETSGLITKSQVVSGTWFTANPSDEVLVYTDYASTKKVKVGGTLTINSKTYKVVGLVQPTLTGDVSDIYFPLSTMQSLASAPGYVNEVLVSVKSSSDVAAVTKAIKAELPGATVLTSKSLADTVSGSLSNAHKLANDLGGVLAIVVLLAAFLIAGLLTLSSVAKRVREIGSLRAIGWTRGEVVRQVMAETVGIGIVGGVIGVAIGAGVCAVIAAVGPGLSVTSTGLAGGCFDFEPSGRHVEPGHRDFDRAPLGPDPRHDDPYRLRRSARRRSHRRHDRWMARRTPRAGLSAEEPRLMAPRPHEETQEDGETMTETEPPTTAVETAQEASPPKKVAPTPLYELSAPRTDVLQRRSVRQGHPRGRPRDQTAGRWSRSRVRADRARRPCCSCSAPSTVRRAARSASRAATRAG